MTSSIQGSGKGGVFALGNFDGVHRGHQVVISAALDKARNMGVTANVLTFEPHPRSLFQPNTAPFRLTPAQVKIRLLQGLAIAEVNVIPFTPTFSQLSASAFVEEILVHTYGVQHIVAGFDFVFGFKRAGNMENLRSWLSPHNVGVTEVAPFRDAEGEIMSSSRARQALQEGNLRAAEHVLGRSWSIAGIVQKGAQRGRELGFPTANIGLGDYLRPKFGVYAILAARVGKSEKWRGVANIGVRPTVDGKEELLEFHLFDFQEEIYGQEWEVVLLHFLRPERSFSDIDALRAQIISDVMAAKAMLA